MRHLVDSIVSLDKFSIYGKAYMIMLIAVICPPKMAHAHHPSEGNVPLKDLIHLALEASPELKSAEQELESIQYQLKAANGKLFPQLGIEGGPFESRSENSFSSGTTAYFKVDWNLYRGGLDHATHAELDLEIQKKRIQNEALRSKLVNKVSRAYYELLFLLESSSLITKALEMNKDQRELARIKQRAGFTSESDVLEFELREATLLSDLRMREQDISEKYHELAQLIGKPDSPATLAIKGHLAKNLDQAWANKTFSRQVIESSFELAAARLSVKQSELATETKKSEYFPKIDLQALYGRLNSEGRLPQSYNNYSFGITVYVPLFSGLETQNQVRSSLSKTLGQKMAYSDLLANIKTQATILESRLVAISDRLQLEEKNLEKSQKYYELALAEYKRGIKNSPDVVGASERLLDIRIRNLEYRRDYHLTQIRAEELLGALSDH